MSSTKPRRRARTARGRAGTTLYSDSLVEISDDAITLRRYYFPFGSRRIPFSEIERISSHDPTLLNGRWRIWGTGTFRTWYPLDFKRPLRDRVFFVTLANGWGRLGFTVEDSKRVTRILQRKGVAASGG